MEMKGQHEAMLRKFYTQDLLAEYGEDFSQRFTGYLLVYAPYYIHFFETDEDDEIHNTVMHELNKSIGGKIHEQIWVLHDTEEVPTRSFGQWYSKALTANKSQAEIKSMSQFERIEFLYSAMLQIGAEVTEIQELIEQGKKSAKAWEALLE